MPSARRLATVATLAVVTLVGGCSDEPEPRFAEPTEGSSPQQSESSDPSPEEASEGGQSAQGQIVIEFIDAISTSLGSGDPSAISTLTSPECAACRSIERALLAAYRNGGRITGAEWTLISQELQGATADGGQLWFADVSTTEETWIGANGRVTKVVPAGTQLLAINVSGGPAPKITDLRFRES